MQYVNIQKLPRHPVYHVNYGEKGKGAVDLPLFFL